MKNRLSQVLAALTAVALLAIGVFLVIPEAGASPTTIGVGDAGVVTVGRSGDSLQFLEILPSIGWSSNVGNGSGQNIDVELTDGERVIRLTVELVQGALQAQITEFQVESPDDTVVEEAPINGREPSTTTSAVETTTSVAEADTTTTPVGDSTTTTRPVQVTPTTKPPAQATSTTVLATTTTTCVDEPHVFDVTTTTAAAKTTTTTAPAKTTTNARTVDALQGAGSVTFTWTASSVSASAAANGGWSAEVASGGSEAAVVFSSGDAKTVVYGYLSGSELVVEVY